MYLVILVECIADKRAVHMTPVGRNGRIRRSNNSSGGCAQRLLIAAEVPYNICTALIECCSVDIAKIKVISLKIRGINVYDHADPVILSKQLYQSALIILIVSDVVRVGGNDHRLTGLYLSAHDILICTLKSGAEAGGSLYPPDVFKELITAVSDSIQRPLDIILRLVCIGIAYSQPGRVDIQQLIMRTVGVETSPVAVIGIFTLKAEIQHYLNISVSRNARHVKPVGIRGSSAEVHGISAGTDRTGPYDIAVLQIELVYAFNCGVALEVVDRGGLGIKPEIVHRIHNAVEIIDRLRLAVHPINVFSKLIVYNIISGVVKIS